MVLTVRIGTNPIFGQAFATFLAQKVAAVAGKTGLQFATEFPASTVAIVMHFRTFLAQGQLLELGAKLVVGEHFLAAVAGE
jgi:hypothetical protein